jgi:hypothetical protein
MASGLAQALRENCGYLRDEGWHEMAILVERAANELDRLYERVEILEAQTTTETPQEKLGRSLKGRRLRRPRPWVSPKQN